MDALVNGKKVGLLYEPKRNKTNKMTCAASEDSDQTGRISLRCPHEEAQGP